MERAHAGHLRGSGEALRASLRAWWPELALALAGAVLLFWRLGSASWVNGDEAFYHGVAEAMLASGDFFRIEFRGEHRLYDTFMNAPLQYWLRAGLIAVLGNHTWSARLPSALCAAASVVAVYRLALALADRASARWSAAVLLTTYQWLYLHGARTGELESALGLLLVLAMASLLRAVRDGGSFLGFHACLALLLNVKLPVAIVPAAAGLAWLLLEPTLRPRLGAWLRCGLAVLPFALLWHGAQLWLHGRASLEVFAMMGAQGAGGAGAPARAGGEAEGQLAYYGRVLLFGAHPWTALQPFALGSILRRPERPRAADPWRLLALALAALAVFYLLVFKRAPWYVTPAYPLLALFVGSWLARLGARAALRPPDLLACCAALAVLCALGVEALSGNPFAAPAVHVDMRPEWRGVPGLGLAIGVVGACVALRRWRHLGQAVAAALLAAAAFRVGAPLRFADYVSPVAQLAASLAQLEREGLAVDEPIEVPLAPPWIVRSYFADDYRIRLVTRRGPDGPRSLYLLSRREGAAGTEALRREAEIPAPPPAPPAPDRGRRP